MSAPAKLVNQWQRGNRLEVRCTRRRLANSLAALFALSSPLAGFAQTTWTVNSCDEGNSGTGTIGTLRYAAANAASGDKIDMSGLNCSTISLQTGAIVLGQTDITVAGPGVNALTITGVYNGTTEHDRIFKHTGTGTLDMYDFAVSDGYLINLAYQAVVAGGCIYSAGAMTLVNLSVHDCSTHIDNGFGFGGGIYAKQTITLKYAVLSNNTATGINYTTVGGGAYSKGDFAARYSTISGNVATTQNFAEGYGGGVHAAGNLTIMSSTIVGNYAGSDSGGIDSDGGYFFQPNLTTAIYNSTISGNRAGSFVGGLYSNLGKIQVYNSTIAFNFTNYSSSDNSSIAAGIFVQNFRGVPQATVVSTLIAGNTTAGVANDFSIRTNGTITGSNNLVMTSNVTMPADTITACPLLGPLRDNGGPTQTHALLSGSPGIDQGSNPKGYKEDQRGILKDRSPYPYPRSSGSGPDIGAYEVQQSDIIFNSAFDPCA